MKLVAEGDSITAGNLVDNPETNAYPAVAVAGIPNPPTITLANIGTTGTLALQMNEDFDTRSGAEYDASKDLNVFTILAGANDKNLTYADKEIYLNLRSVLHKAKAKGFDRRLIGTLIATDEDANEYRQWGGDILLNQLIRQYWNSDLDADGIFDFGSDPHFDEIADADDLTYYDADKVHPTQAGHVVLAAIYKPVVAAAIAGPTARVELPATWFEVDCSSELALKNGDRTAYWPVEGFTNASVRGARGKSQGKWYFETQHKVVDTTTGVGLMNIDFAGNLFANWNDIGNDPNSIGYMGNEGEIRYNGTNLATMGQILDTDVIAIAFDADAHLVWFRRNSGNWNGDALADPATGMGGIDISALGTGPLYPVGFILNSGCEITSRFAAGETTGTIPTGFTVIGA
ncbi:GDSL-type esterase/lipase family protein [Rhizobium sp. L43]|uniref:GDSL-type esterase/lipase family protein n=1 Tax=Rhizobium sp. L43 TaxID=2035452 RepID=UPI0015CF4DF4|nr:GDSL-type esterase/lipase family protein [Rhizobium sp. L43]